jgi:DedD protein
MDRQLLERMVGATVLIIALVVIAPAILDGPGDDGPALPSPAADGHGVRTVTIRPDRPAAEPPVARVAVASPDPAPATPAAALAEPAPAPQPAPPEPEARVAPQAPKPAPKAEPRPVPQSAIERSGWAVQLGSFANRDNANRLAGKISAKGYDVYLAPLERAGGTLYRVRVGPRPSRESAAQLAGELAKAGYKGQVAQEGPAS